MILSSPDIILEAGNALFFFRFLEWDSNFFGRPCYMLDNANSNLIASDKIIELFKQNFRDSFVSAKINTLVDYSIVQILQECGFRYIDTEVILKSVGALFYIQENNDIKVVKQYCNAKLPHEELGSAFSFSRFHTDVNITESKADSLWVNYLKNYQPDDNHHMFVAFFRDEPAGIILANQNVKQVVLFFVAVLSDFQNKGVGSNLIQKVVQNFKGFSITTGTQIKNTKALNFYIRNGFSTITLTKTILHMW